jgi:hypothetical protein
MSQPFMLLLHKFLYCGCSNHRVNEKRQWWLVKVKICMWGRGQDGEEGEGT